MSAERQDAMDANEALLTCELRITIQAAKAVRRARNAAGIRHGGTPGDVASLFARRQTAALQWEREQKERIQAMRSAEERYAALSDGSLHYVEVAS